MGAQAFVPRSLSPATPDAPSGARGRGAEASALLLFAAALFLFLGLATLEFDPADPTVHGADWMGAVGAWVATLFVQGFGAAAWFVPVESVLLGLPLFKGEFPEQFSLRLAGDLVILILLASLLQVAVPHWLVFGQALAGGNVGLFFGELMRGLFSAPGSFLVGSTGVGLILIGRASFSFIDLCERMVMYYRAALAFALRLGERSFGAWKQARQLRAEQVRVLAQESAPAPDADADLLSYFSEDNAWVPGEATGKPPLAIVESLRRGFEATRALDDSSDFSAFVEYPAPPLSSSEAAPASRDGFWSGLLDESSPPPADSDEEEDEIVDEADSEEEEDESDEDEIVDEESEDEDSEEDESDEDEIVDEEDDESEEESDEDETEEVAEPRIVDTKPAQATRAVIPRGKKRVVAEFELPSTDLLERPSGNEKAVDRQVLLRHAQKLEKTLLDYGVVGQTEEIHPGPTVTTFEFSPTAGTKVSKVAGLADDLALGLSRKVRIIAPIPGKNRIGFELPNDDRQAVNLRELVEDERFQNLGKKAPLPVVLGRDIVGAPFYADLASMPHVIVAGATGAGKSVGLNVMLSSLLFMRSPEELRLLMIDPKVVELAPFDKIPHLLLPVVTDMKQAAKALAWAVDEMERRYQLFADAGTKNITTYNRWVERVIDGEIPPPKSKEVDAVGFDGETVVLPAAKQGGDGAQLPEKMPFIVIVVDEFADLMMQQGKEVEVSVARLAQKARAAGMHVILATQRPSVDVITGMIKANFPSRIAFRVAQKVDSRTILDEQGAEVLLGRGDMLVKLNGSTDTLRVQCPFVSEEEVSALTDHLRAQGEPRYQESILAASEDEEEPEVDEKTDSRFEEAVLIVRETQRCSTSWLQRKMTVGYNRAAKIVEMMERRGYVGPPNGSRDREVLIPPG